MMKQQKTNFRQAAKDAGFFASTGEDYYRIAVRNKTGYRAVVAWLNQSYGADVTVSELPTDYPALVIVRFVEGCR